VKGSIAEKYRLLKNAPWGGSTNFEATFNLILKKAKENNVPQEEMPEVIVCLSDMGFDCASRSYSGTEFNPTALQMAKQKYESAGYKMPLLVMWNLRSDFNGAPAMSQDTNIVMISGFSTAIMASVLSGNYDEITPEAMMLRVLNSSRYDSISV
jgi:hypothetical protein